MYTLPFALQYNSPRYGKTVTVPEGFVSDGATGAIDIHSDAWWVHDYVCETGQWDDGTPITNWEASTIMSDILRRDSRYIRAVYWWVATWLLGGGKARENGLW